VNALSSILENFEPSANVDGAEDVRSQQLKAAAYAEGVAAGKATAAAEYEAERVFLERAIEQVGQVLNAVPDQINGQIGEALGAILHKTLPTLAEKGFADEAVGAVLKNIDTNDCGSIVVTTSAENVDSLKEIFASLEQGEHVQVESDPTFKGAMVAANWNSAGLTMNVDAAVSQLLEIFDSFVSHPKKENNHDE